jgi:DNA-binding response OmpR family regulator
MTYTVLACDDDEAILRSIGIYLRTDGYDVLEAQDGQTCLDLLAEREVHCLLLDIMMPGLDGMEVMRRLRRTCNAPVILLTAKSEDADKIAGLHYGADDYVTKPFNPMELLARVKSQIRRYTQFGANVENSCVMRTGELRLDPEAKEVTVDGEPVRLTATEYALLLHFMQNIGKTMSVRELFSAVWKTDYIDSDNTVAVHIRRLREKIEINPSQPKYIKVVWGIGYRLERL